MHDVLSEQQAEWRTVLWNIVPTHPHPVGEPLKNRRLKKVEIDRGAVFAWRLIEIVQPRLVIAVGRKAEWSLKKSGLSGAPYVRHPANGGATRFKEGMRELLA